MEAMSEMHHTMSHMHHVSSNGIVGQALGLAGRLSAQLLIVLTSAPVLKVIAALVLVLAVALLLRLLLARRTSQS
jgi:uncharacterized membrane protein YqhA